MFPDTYTIGEMRNILVRRANGSILCHFDSDDWSHPRRIETQVESLRYAEACGAPLAYFLDEKENKGWKFDANALTYETTYRLGASLAYRRSAWDRCNFDPWRNEGEDSIWQWMAKPTWGPDLPASMFVAIRHEGNATTLDTRSAAWSDADPAAIRRIMEA